MRACACLHAGSGVMRCTSGRRPTLQARRFADQEQVDALAAHMDSFIQASRHATCCTCLAVGAAVQQWLLCGARGRMACRVAVAAAPGNVGCRPQLNCLLPSPSARPTGLAGVLGCLPRAAPAVQPIPGQHPATSKHGLERRVGPGGVREPAAAD